MAGTDLTLVAGSKLYIGGTLATKATDFVASDFAVQSWTLIDGWSTMGSYGDVKNIVKTDLINRKRTTKQGGTVDAGSMQNVFAKIDTDAGQVAVNAAMDTNDNYAFKIEFDDSLGGSPSQRLFIAIVASAPEAGGSANTAQNLNVNMEINSNIVRVAAT